MAYITKKKIKGKLYYYAEHREWKDGKSRRIWQKYLGSIEKIMDAIEGKDVTPAYSLVFEFGAIAAYLSIAEQINLVENIDSMLPKRSQGISIGEYILLAVINRGVDAVSKSSMWKWFENTILFHCKSHIKRNMLSSQRFWDNMSLIQESTISEIWMNIINQVITKYNIDLSRISYDGTNFYTFISTFNMRSTIAKRGKNKQGRNKLRQVSYALFCSKKDHIPLFFDIYDGNTADSKEFSRIVAKFRKVFGNRVSENSPMTIIFDKGNNSKKNIKQIDEGPFNFVGTVKLSEHKDLASISNESKKFVPCEHPKLNGIKAHRLKKNIYQKARTVIVMFNPKLYRDQVGTINNDIQKCLDNLAILSKKLQDRANGLIRKGKKPTLESVKKAVKDILKRQYMKDLIKIEYQINNEIPLFSYKEDGKALSNLMDTVLGKKVVITDNHNWKTDDIILAYHGQYVIEDAFKESKDRKIGTWWPMYHYTDQKIKVHGLYCTITLLLRSLMSRHTRLNKINISINRLHEELSGIKEVLTVYTKSEEASNKNIKSHYTLTKRNEIQDRLFDLFNLQQYNCC